MDFKIWRYVLLFIWSNVKKTHGLEIIQPLRDMGIVPGMLPEPPKELAHVQFGRLVLFPGDFIEPQRTAARPLVEWYIEPYQIYSLILTGFTNISAVPSHISTTEPSQPRKFDEWHQWIQVNVPANEIDEGEAIYRYTQTKPSLIKEEVYCYIFTVWKQKSFVEKPPRPKYCPKFKFRELIPTYTLATVHLNCSELFAANYFCMQQGYKPKYYN